MVDNSPNNNHELEKKLWKAADQLRANSKLTAQEYSRPVFGLIFLKYADFKFSLAEKQFEVLFFYLSNVKTAQRK